MESTLVSPEKLDNFIYELLIKSKLDPEEASIIKDNFIWSDLVGRHNYGVWRLVHYLQRFEKGLIKSPCHLKFSNSSGTICSIDGQDGFGQYVGHRAMNKAIHMAKNNGVGIVGVKNSNHFGTAAYFVNLACQNGQIGMAMTNSIARVAPPGGISPIFGPNPFAFGCPLKDEYPILIDFATSAITGTEVIRAKEQRKNIPEGMVINDKGESIVDPTEALNGIFLPFGGIKGYCMILMIEILSGVLTGAAISYGVASMFKNFKRTSNVGHFFLALDISKILPLEQYFERMSELINIIKSSKKLKGVTEILIPGEIRWRCFEEQKRNGIMLDSKAIDNLQDLAQSLEVAVPW